MGAAKKLLEEVVIASRLLDGAEWLNWTAGLCTGLPTVVRHRTLDPLDQRVGSEFSFRSARRQIQLSGASFGVVREIFGRHAYISADELSECRTVVDLGANCGIFSLFALLNAPAAHVHAIDMQPAMVAALNANVSVNGFASRITAATGMIGPPYDEWSRQFSRDHPEVLPVNLEELMERVGPCDFLKCDIEGAEYHIVNQQMRWLDAVRRFSMEYHGTPADGERLASVLRLRGFQVKRRDHGKLGYLDGIRM